MSIIEVSNSNILSPEFNILRVPNSLRKGQQNVYSQVYGFSVQESTWIMEVKPWVLAVLS